MKSIIVFDDEIFSSFKNTLKPKIVDNWDNWYLKASFNYWMKVYWCWMKKKEFIRYMFHKKRRIQKKWDKIYNDRYREININPMTTFATV